MAKLGAAAVAATGVGGTGAAALGAYGMGYFGDGSGSSTGNFTNPKHKQLIADGHVYSPISAPENEQIPTSNSNKYNWNNWDCVKKLFPGLTVNHSEPTKSLDSVSKETIKDEQAGKVQTTKDYYFKKAEDGKDGDDFVVCALFDKRGDANAHNKNIFFKSEVAVQGKNHGWIMWNGLSTTPSASRKTYLEYRLLLLKKTGENWTIDKGFGWDSPQTNEGSAVKQIVYDQLYAEPPTGSWKTTYKNVGSYSSRKIWSGIARVDKSSTEDEEDDEGPGKHIVGSLKVYMQGKNSDGQLSNYDEFYGTSGSWNDDDKGYSKANRVYDNGEWKTITTPINLKDSLTKWYEDYQNKNVKWMTCDQWASGEGLEDWDETMQKMCYSSTTTNKPK